MATINLKYGYSSEHTSAVAITQSDETVINILASGNPKAATSQNYFYLFVPYYKGDSSRPTFNSSPPFVDYRRESEIKIGQVAYYYVQGYGELYEGSENYGYYIYKVTVNENIGTSNREGTFSITFYNFLISASYPSPPDWAYPDARTTTITFKVLQEGAEAHSETPTDNNLYYHVDNVLNTSISTSQMIKIQSYPQILSDSYSYLSSSDTNINQFKYVYLRTASSNSTNLVTTSEATWASLQEVHHSNDGLYIFQVQVENSSQQYARNTVLEVKQGGQTVIQLYITQYGTSSGSQPEIDTSISEDADISENKYWEEAGASQTVSVIDTNAGSSVDATSLLFKSNFANIYSTIEQKDGTLFLGNYISNQTINKVHQVMGSYIGTEKILCKEGIRKVPVLYKDSQDYPYIPNMLQSSQQKRIFKPGETYALGIVFVDKNGTWSSVYYLGDIKGKWSVSRSLEPHLISSGGETFYNKPVQFVVLSQEVTNALSSLGVVAAFPVYAVKQSNTIMCQGFLSPTLQSSMRNINEAVESQYSWFYRDKFSVVSADYLSSGMEGGHDTKELQCLDTAINSQENYNSWQIYRQICSLNTPEVEVDERLSDAMLQNAQCRSIWNYTDFSYNNNVILQVNGKYVKSYFSTAHAYERNGNYVSVQSKKDSRFISGYLWYGFVDHAYSEENRLGASGNDLDNNYSWYIVYPWQRSTIGGEGPTSLITNKRLFNSLYIAGLTVNSTQFTNLPDVIDATIYRDYDTASIIKIGNSVYQGNVDYIATTESANAYKAWIQGTYILNGKEYNYPIANKESGSYAGYDTEGNIVDPISMKYKTAPHIVLKFDGNVRYRDNQRALFCVELLNSDITLKTDVQDLQGYQWIKCGDMKRVLPTEQTILFYEEGDYFFGRFDSLRTYCYAENDVNSVVEIVSGMLCSRVNLDSRCDRNRGAMTPTVSPENFNLFNPVYNQLNNYFTFSYVNIDDLIYSRKYSNSIQWSLTKEYSSNVDNWCNIQDINTLDFDGDKGQIQSIERLGNELIVFQDTAISQIQYNEKTQIATNEGVAIEIANSGKVDGKHYLYDHIGCQYRGSISKSPNGIYFVDSINKSLYQLGADSKLTDLCTVGGMKSWGLANLDNTWWSYYDINSQEVLFSNDVETLAFSDAYGKFNSFVGYGGIRWNFRANDSTIQICPVNFTQVIATTSPTLFSSKRTPAVTSKLNNLANTFWKKNSIDETKFFDNYSPVEIQLQCNPEPTVDKMFSVVEFRADCFDENGNYLPDITFDTFRAWNEYQDTLETDLKYNQGYEHGPVYNTVYSTRLRKKFRIWRIDIPRAYYGSTTYIRGNEATVPDITDYVHVNPAIEAPSGNLSRDRIRNPWCNIYLSMDTSRTYKIIFNDLAIQYFK